MRFSALAQSETASGVILLASALGCVSQPTASHDMHEATQQVFELGLPCSVSGSFSELLRATFLGSLRDRINEHQSNNGHALDRLHGPEQNAFSLQIRDFERRWRTLKLSLTAETRFESR